jgi:plastocyanin
MVRWVVALSRIALVAASLLGLPLSNSGPVAVAGARPAMHTVVIDSMRFEPARLTVNVGDEIEWFNHDPFPHTVTAQDGEFDSGEIGPGRSWHYLATTPGVITYACGLHPAMAAELRVE